MTAHEQLMWEWHRLRPSKAQRCLRVVQGRQCVAYNNWRRDCLCQVVQRGVLFSHTRIWLDSDGHHVLTSEPYTVSRQTVAALIEQTSDLGIALTISDRSPWGAAALLLMSAVRMPAGITQCSECKAAVPYPDVASWHDPGC
jgi:hypothetical protein